MRVIRGSFVSLVGVLWGGRRKGKQGELFLEGLLRDVGVNRH